MSIKKVLIDRNAHLKIPKGDKLSCAIVGNAQSIFKQAKGDLIDSCDITVRINVSEIISPLHQGSRTNYIFAHSLTYPKLVKRAKCPVINVSTHLKDLSDYWSTVISQDNGYKKAKPTTGFLAIVFFLNKGYNVNLFGFDWYETKTYYKRTNDPWEHHFPSWEKNKVKELLNESLRYNS